MLLAPTALLLAGLCRAAEPSDPDFFRPDNGCPEGLNFYGCRCSEAAVDCVNQQFKDAQIFRQITPAKFPRLQRLTVHGNNFAHLPADLFGPGVVHQHLRYADLSANYLLSLDPDALLPLRGVETLNLSHNQVVLSPGGTPRLFAPLAATLTTLVLNAAFNGVSNTSRQVELLAAALKSARLERLQRLSANGNFFPVLPASLGCSLPALTELHWEENSVGTLNAAPKDCWARLQLLNLRRNAFRTLDAATRRAVESLPNDTRVLLGRNLNNCDACGNQTAADVDWLKRQRRVADGNQIRCHRAKPERFEDVPMLLVPLDQLDCRVGRAVRPQFPSARLSLLLPLVTTLLTAPRAYQLGPTAQ